MKKPRKTSPRRSPSSKAPSRAKVDPVLDVRLTKLLKRAVTLTREIRKVAKLLGANVPKVTIKVKK